MNITSSCLLIIFLYFSKFMTKGENCRAWTQDWSRASGQNSNQVMKHRFETFENTYVEVLRAEWSACS